MIPPLGRTNTVLLTCPLIVQANPIMSSTHDSGLSAQAAKKLSLLPPRAYLAAPQPGLIHLNQAENYVIRPELLGICKTAIDKELTEEVRTPTAHLGV